MMQKQALPSSEQSVLFLWAHLHHAYLGMRGDSKRLVRKACGYAMNG